jgi:hypothetical protein
MCHARDPVLRNFTRFAAKNAEHTQGVEGDGNQPGSQRCIWQNMVGFNCPGDRYWSNTEFAAVHNTQRNMFPGADDSWLEERKFSELAVQAVPPSHPLAVFLREETSALAPRPANTLPPLSPVEALARTTTPMMSESSRGGPLTVTCTRGSSSAILTFTSSGSIDSLTFSPR